MAAARPKREVSAETRRRISDAMKGKRNAAGKHNLSDEGREAIAEAQRERWRRYREEKAKEEK